MAINRQHPFETLAARQRQFRRVLVWPVVAAFIVGVAPSYFSELVPDRYIMIGMMVVAIIAIGKSIQLNRALIKMSHDPRTFALPLETDVYGYCPVCYSDEITQYGYMPTLVAQAPHSSRDMEFFYRCDHQHQFDRPFDDFQLQLVKDFGNGRSGHLGALRPPSRLSRLFRRAPAAGDKGRSDA